MTPEIQRGLCLDILLEYTKAQLRMLEANPTVSTGTIYYKLKKTIEYMEAKKGEKNGVHEN